MGMDIGTKEAEPMKKVHVKSKGPFGVWKRVEVFEAKGVPRPDWLCSWGDLGDIIEDLGSGEVRLDQIAAAFEDKAAGRFVRIAEVQALLEAYCPKALDAYYERVRADVNAYRAKRGKSPRMRPDVRESASSAEFSKRLYARCGGWHYDRNGNVRAGARRPCRVCVAAMREKGCLRVLGAA